LPGREHTDGAECWVAHSTEAFARQRIEDSQPLQRNGMFTPHTSDQKAVIAKGEAASYESIHLLDLGSLPLPCHSAEGL